MITVIWMLIYWFIRKRANAKLIYSLLRCIVTGYIFPFVFLGNRLMEWFVAGPRNVLFEVTNDIQVLIAVIFFIWATGVLFHIVMDIWSYIQFKRIRRNRIDVTWKYKALIQQVQAEVKINRKVRLYQGYSVVSPFVCGVIKPSIYIAPDKYSDKELEMMVMHEMCHIKQRDIIWKPVFLIISCIYWFNPFAWFVVRQLRYWAEAGCDEFCCTDRYRKKDYFDAILDLSDKTYRRHTSKFAPMWSEGENELKWRVRCMKRNIKKKITKKAVAIVAAFAMFGASISTYAADLGSVKLYNKIFCDTDTGIEEEITEYEEGVEYTGTIDDFEGLDLIEANSDIATASTMTLINWPISKKTAYASVKFRASKGGEIYVSVGISPTDKYVKVGIIQPDDTTRYVYSKGNIVHTFSLTQSGYYKVYITNGNSSAVTAYGYYSY
jgi:beta-lactamase regulating signal transducer with metallopeptidase domain